MSSFTIRVYGICIEDGGVLVSDEYIHETQITKFPGGGLHFGEGTIDCLKRELMEETSQQIEVLEHFYTTDFFQPSLFDPAKQVISIYYFFRFIDPVRFRVSKKVFDFEELKTDAQSFRWLRLSELNDGQFTLPIDRHVGALLAAKFSAPG